MTLGTLVAIIILLPLFIGFVFLAMTVEPYEDPCDNFPKPKSCMTQRERCEDVGGIYLLGGWGSVSCTFPPSNPI